MDSERKHTSETERLAELVEWLRFEVADLADELDDVATDVTSDD